MAEYINREAAIKKFKERCTKCDARFEDQLCLQCSGRSDLEIVCDLPAADVEPVVHGEWLLKHIGAGHYWECSICHTNPCIYVTQHTKFCPNCGAKMDGGVNE